MPKISSNPNSKKHCADCLYHNCNLGCMKNPKEKCLPTCELGLKPRKCYLSSKNCESFKQINWSEIL